MTARAFLAVVVACLALSFAAIVNSIGIERLESRIEQLEQQVETP